jgi:predicted nucleic acid-binding protein
MLHFFIDTNVLLSFYGFTQDNLNRLERLADQIDAGTFIVLTTSQVEDEFARNREAKIAEGRKQIASQRLDIQLPRLCEPYPETPELRRLAREYSELHGQLVARITEDTRTRSLMADQLIDRFFNGARRIDVTPEIVASARLRVELGNPPGKRGSLGDAVNWEALLAFRPDDRLFFVTSDGDYYSPADASQPHGFLIRDWRDSVGQEISFVRRLSELPEEVPHDVLPVDDAAEDDRDYLIWSLANSGNFAHTHMTIAQLRQVQHFTRSQASELLAALENDQVGWIIHDDDVHAFYARLLDSQREDLSEAEVERLVDKLAPPDF